MAAGSSGRMDSDIRSANHPIYWDSFKQSLVMRVRQARMCIWWEVAARAKSLPLRLTGTWLVNAWCKQSPGLHASLPLCHMVRRQPPHSKGTQANSCCCWCLQVNARWRKNYLKMCKMTGVMSHAALYFSLFMEHIIFIVFRGKHFTQFYFLYS